jgi:hypothetical protein
MIPKAARDLIDLHKDQASKAETSEFAERMLHAAEAMLGYALAANHIKPSEHATEIVLISLIRAQRQTRPCTA